MPLFKAKIAHEYDRVQRQVGDVFEVEQRHVAFMTALGRIEPEDGQARETSAGSAATYETRVMTAEPRARRANSRKAA